MADIKRVMPELEGQEMLFVGGLVKEMTDTQADTFAVAYRSQRRDPTTVLLLTLLGAVGIVGLHRLYLGQIGMGLLYLFTAGFCFIGTVIDFGSHKKLAFQYNQIKAATIATMVRSTFSTGAGLPSRHADPAPGPSNATSEGSMTSVSTARLENTASEGLEEYGRRKTRHRAMSPHLLLGLFVLSMVIFVILITVDGETETEPEAIRPTATRTPHSKGATPTADESLREFVLCERLKAHMYQTWGQTPQAVYSGDPNITGEIEPGDFVRVLTPRPNSEDAIRLEVFAHDGRTVGNAGNKVWINWTFLAQFGTERDMFRCEN